MVKIHCDKCGKEIKDRYYTINIYGYDTNPQFDCYATADCASAYSNTREGMLKMLNNTKMYCKNCVNKVEAYLQSNNEFSFL